MKYIVYLTTNKINGLIYIGVHKTKNPDSFDGYLGCSVYAHRPHTYKNPITAFQYAVNKFGPKNFVRKTLFIYDKRKDAYNKEAEIVDWTFVKQDNNYNMTPGGRGGYAEPRKVYQFSKEGILIAEWENVEVASQELGLSINSIYTAIQFRESSRKTFWSFDESIDISKFSKGNEAKITYQYDKWGKLLQIHESLSNAAKSINITASEISTAIKFQQLIREEYYFSNTLVDKFEKSPRKSLRGNSFYLYTYKGEFIRKFDTAPELQDYFKLKSWATLSKAINHNNGIYKTYQITTEYKEKLKEIVPTTQNKPVLVYKDNGEFVGEYESERAAARELDCRMSQINRVLREVAHTHKGYIFKWKVNDIV